MNTRGIYKRTCIKNWVILFSACQVSLYQNPWSRDKGATFCAWLPHSIAAKFHPHVSPLHLNPAHSTPEKKKKMLDSFHKNNTIIIPWTSGPSVVSVQKQLVSSPVLIHCMHSPSCHKNPYSVSDHPATLIIIGLVNILGRLMTLTNIMCLINTTSIYTCIYLTIILAV